METGAAGIDANHPDIRPLEIRFTWVTNQIISNFIY